LSDKKQENKPIQKKSGLVVWAVFLFALSIVLINLVSVVFPALVVSNNSTIEQLQEFGIDLVDVDSFTIGVWVGPLVFANIIVFALAILYFKKRLPTFITKLINFVFSFEVSKKMAFIAIVVLLGGYILVSASDLTTEEKWEDYTGIKKRLERWSPDQITQGFEPHVRYFLLWSSMILFGNYTVIPFIASISLLLLTYFFTVEITKKRFAGIISIIILLQSNVFLTYDSTVSYTNFWTLFYLLSLFLIFKVWPLSPVSYFLSIASKPLSMMFLPMSLFFIYNSNLSRNKKIIVAVPCIAIILAGVLIAISGFHITAVTGTEEEFSSDEFWMGFTSFSYQLRFDGLVLVFILPLIVGLFIASRKGILHADSIMVLIGGILFTAPLLTGFTELTSQPYRFVPVIVFFSIGIGVLFSKRKFLI